MAEPLLAPTVQTPRLGQIYYVLLLLSRLRKATVTCSFQTSVAVLVLTLNAIRLCVRCMRAS